MSLTPENIAEKEFTLGLRGYDKEEVRSYLQTVANSLSAAIDAASDSASAPGYAPDCEADEPSPKATTAGSADESATADDGTQPGSSTPDWSNLGDEIASVLRTAHEQANGLRADAESKASAIQAQAQQAADAAHKAAERDRTEAAASVAELAEQIAVLTSTRDEVLAELATLRSRLDDTIAASSGDKVSAS
ncbi:MAG: DivIVA domain-containing protein [Aquihabitans sp.]